MPGDDVVLGGVAMPADGRARTVLVDQSHGKRFGIDASPLGNLGAQRKQERWKRPSWPDHTIGRRTPLAAEPRRRASGSQKTRHRQLLRSSSRMIWRQWVTRHLLRPPR